VRARAAPFSGPSSSDTSVGIKFSAACLSRVVGGGIINDGLSLRVQDPDHLSGVIASRREASPKFITNWIRRRLSARVHLSLTRGLVFAQSRDAHADVETQSPPSSQNLFYLDLIFTHFTLILRVPNFYWPEKARLIVSAFVYLSLAN
jgi:hypothetical protein